MNTYLVSHVDTPDRTIEADSFHLCDVAGQVAVFTIGDEDVAVVRDARTITKTDGFPANPFRDLSIQEFLSACDWGDTLWRTEMNVRLAELIKERTQLSDLFESMGTVVPGLPNGRHLVKGVRGTRAYWITPDDRFLETAEPESSALELTPVDLYRFELTRDEMAMAAGDYDTFARVVDEAATKCRREATALAHQLATGAGWAIDADSLGGPVWPVAPFRMEFSGFGMRQREWVGENDELWHLACRSQITAGAFVPVAA